MATNNTVRLHRVLAAPPDRVYRAFIDPDAMAKWLPPHGFTGHVHEMDARVGGRYRMSFTNFSSGQSHSFGGEFLEIVPNERIRYTDRFDDPNLPGVIEVTVLLKPNAPSTVRLPSMTYSRRPAPPTSSGPSTTRSPGCTRTSSGHPACQAQRSASMSSSSKAKSRLASSIGIGCQSAPGISMHMCRPLRNSA